MWKPDPGEISNRLGWLRVAEASKRSLDRLTGLADGLRRAGLPIWHEAVEARAPDGRRLVLRDTAVAVSRIKAILEEAPARAKVIVLDACPSGADVGGKVFGFLDEAHRFITDIFIMGG